MRLAADIGGTFNDVAAFDEENGRLIRQVLSTRRWRSIAAGSPRRHVVLCAGLFRSALPCHQHHLERTGAKTRSSSPSFRDIYEIGRVPSICNPSLPSIGR
jgi:hypothetical protein